jgi:hypothetical protein
MLHLFAQNHELSRVPQWNELRADSVACFFATACMGDITVHRALFSSAIGAGMGEETYVD